MRDIMAVSSPEIMLLNIWGTIILWAVLAILSIIGALYLPKFIDWLDRKKK